MDINVEPLYSHALSVAEDTLARLKQGAFLSFSQNFEDLQIAKILGGFPRTYLDIGCSHPVRNSVTVAAYFSGSAGITIDVLAEATELHTSFRPRDVQITAAVGKEISNVSTVFVASRKSQTTVDGAVGNELLAKGLAERLAGPPSIRLQDVLDEFRGTGLDLLSIDTEGAEADILLPYEFDGVRPKLLVYEAVFPPNAIAESNKGAGENRVRLISAHLERIGYRQIYDDGLNKFWADTDTDFETPTPPTFYDNFVRFEALIMALAVALEHGLVTSTKGLEDLIGLTWAQRIAPIWDVVGTA